MRCCGLLGDALSHLCVMTDEDSQIVTGQQVADCCTPDLSLFMPKILSGWAVVDGVGMTPISVNGKEHGQVER
jgi:hypothetical protein